MIEQTTRAEAASGPDGDDNAGPDRSRRHMIASTMSRRPCQAAAGLRRPSERKPSFAYFPVDYLYLPDDVWRPDEPTDLQE
ncbi:hypothetical protein THAOC_24255 [Thalassiosira oceanica]|uniref:Uncharacterized protein n=1 Tax=Thalassiosira oceanica TaxID=159749 RepID=K0S4T8_THAOC|nr:hypothetical protein THAOC_24255 [Thalassiosira oceanica]|eukprot:EJK55946.1 hypothetical protein THAOC_24255 [Thalassiosira oceanica]